MEESKRNTLSQEERVKAASFWSRHEKNLRRVFLKQMLVSDEGLQWLSICTQPNQIGYDQGMIRPGDLGKWDLYYFLHHHNSINQEEALLIADLTLSQVVEEDRRESLRNAGYDPDNAADVRDSEWRKNMTPTERDDEIQRLERLLEFNPLNC